MPQALSRGTPLGQGSKKRFYAPTMICRLLRISLMREMHILACVLLRQRKQGGGHTAAVQVSSGAVRAGGVQLGSGPLPHPGLATDARS